MKFLLMLLSAVLLWPEGAQATSASVQAAFGNTLLTIDPDGRSRKIWLEPNGTWSGLSRRGIPLAGSWSEQGGKVCLTQSRPRLPGRMCHALPSATEATLRARDPSGKTVQLKLVKGRVTH